MEPTASKTSGDTNGMRKHHSAQGGQLPVAKKANLFL